VSSSVLVKRRFPGVGHSTPPFSHSTIKLFSLLSPSPDHHHFSYAHAHTTSKGSLFSTTFSSNPSQFKPMFVCSISHTAYMCVYNYPLVYGRTEQQQVERVMHLKPTLGHTLRPSDFRCGPGVIELKPTFIKPPRTEKQCADCEGAGVSTKGGQQQCKNIRRASERHSERKRFWRRVFKYKPIRQPGYWVLDSTRNRWR